jgi:glycosyltransferase involved in cell wall biosynthesis
VHAETVRKNLTVYAGPPRGGCYERMQRLTQGLLRRGWVVHFVGPLPLLPSHPNLVFHEVRATGQGEPSLRTLARCIYKALAVCRRHRLRDVWSFGAAYTALLAPLRWRGGRIVTFLRGSFAEQERTKGAGPLRRAAARIVERTAVAASDVTIAVSRDLADRAGGTAVVLPNDVHVTGAPPARDEARRNLGLPLDGFLVGYAGAIVPIKDLETLVAAVALVPGAHLALQGFSANETAYERRLRERVRELGLGPRSHLLAWTPGARPLLAALDVVVVPSRHEGSPNVLLEAMALGRPCLGARSGGIEEMLVHDDLLFPAGDAGRLAARLAQLLESPAERERLASLARARATEYEFDWEARAVDLLESAFARER